MVVIKISYFYISKNKDKWKIKPTHVSSAKNHIEVLKYLIQQGADINCEDVFGNTPLGWAVFCKAEECESHLKSLNANYKEFVVPPASEEGEEEVENSQESEDIDETFEQLEIETGHQPRRSSIPVRKGQSTILKVNGTANPSFELNEERQAVTSV